MVNNNFKTNKFCNYKNYINQLENQYLSTFKKIEDYVNNTTKLDRISINNCLLQIIDTFLSGQKQRKAVENITGTDLKKYCDNMIYGESIYIYKVSRICSIIFRTIFYIFFMEFLTSSILSLLNGNFNSILKPVNLGTADIILAIAYLCIPKFLSVITKNYFDNPIYYRKVRKYTNYAITIISIAIYTFVKDMFVKSTIYLTFSNAVLILIYFLIIKIVIHSLCISFNNTLEQSSEKSTKYYTLINIRFEKQKKVSEHKGNSPLNWSKFLKRQRQLNYLFCILFILYTPIYFVTLFFLAKGLLTKGIDTIGIFLLIIITLIILFLIATVNEFLRRNRQLTQIENNN